MPLLSPPGEAMPPNDLDVACYAAGTRIATTSGLVPVEAIQQGDRLCTVLNGDTAEAIWTGRRTVDCTRHPYPEKVWPVQISPHAFGRGMPDTDLFLSPNHAVYVDRVLIPARLLVNGHTVRQVLTNRIAYHHIELAQHDVLLANGMPAESYLDTGNRAQFSNVASVIALYPDFAARGPRMPACARVVQSGRILAAVRGRLAADVARRRRRVPETFAPGSTWPR